MTKIVITDEQIDRAMKAGPMRYRRAGHLRDPNTRQAIKNMIEAALTPEPEIPVTEEMIEAGYAASTVTTIEPESGPDWMKRRLRQAYRAMRKLEPPKPICGELEDGA